MIKSGYATARLVVLLGNFALLFTIACIGITTWLPKEYFEDTSVESIEVPADMGERKRKGPPYTQVIGVLRELAKMLPEDEETAVPPEEKTPDLQIEIKAVMFNKEDPKKSGAHVKVNNSPRFFIVGDNEKLSNNMPYYLREIVEVKPDLEYMLRFQHEDGTFAEKTYKRR